MLGCATLGMPMTLTSTTSWGSSEAGRRQQRDHSLSFSPSLYSHFFRTARMGTGVVLLLHTKPTVNGLPCMSSAFLSV